MATLVITCNLCGHYVETIYSIHVTLIIFQWKNKLIITVTLHINDPNMSTVYKNEVGGVVLHDLRVVLAIYQ